MPAVEIDTESLAKMSREETLELLKALEAQHLAKRREDMTEFARYIEVPGTPKPYTKDDLATLRARKEKLLRRTAPGELHPEIEDETLADLRRLPPLGD